MKELQNTVAKLVVFCRLCRVFVTYDSTRFIEDIKEKAHSIMELIHKQRKEVPNLLNSKIIYKHIMNLSIPYCETVNQLHSRLRFNCGSPSFVSF